MAKYSVALCTYNGEKYIEQQLNSILEQTLPVDEIVIGDDGSEDSTVQIVENILKNTDIEYKIIKNIHNLGFRKNFENTIKNTTGDIIFLSDQDDVWEKDKVEITVGHFENNTNCLMVFSNAYLTDDKMNVQALTLWESVYYEKKKKQYSSWLSLFLSGYYVTGAAMAIRRKLFDLAYPFSDTWYHDGWLSAFASIYGEIEEEPRKLIKYRQHANNQIGTDIKRSFKERINKKREIIKAGAKAQSYNNKFVTKRYSELLERTKEQLDKNKLSEIKNAIDFHEKLSDISGMNKIYGLKTILTYGITGKYKLYCKKDIGTMMGDILFLFI